MVLSSWKAAERSHLTPRISGKNKIKLLFYSHILKKFSKNLFQFISKNVFL